MIDKNDSNSQLNSDLAKISKWDFLTKISKLQKFSNKRDKENYPLSQFNSTGVQIADSQKHLGLILDSILKFNDHIESKITKCNKIIGLMKKLSLTLSRKCSLTIYKSFVRPNLDYADKIYNKPLNESFKKKTEMVQYNVALIIAGAFKGTSRDKIYQ